MLLQITRQARKKVVPLVPVIATSHETRSERADSAILHVPNTGEVPTLLHPHRRRKIRTETETAFRDQDPPKSRERGSIYCDVRTILDVKSHYFGFPCCLARKNFHEGHGAFTSDQLAVIGRGNSARAAARYDDGNRKPRRGVDRGRDK